MTKRHRSYVGISDSQANADALYRRDHTFTEPSADSFRVAWDWRKRQPKELREAVRMVRAAYSADVPTKLHDGPDAIGVDGTPRMTARAEGYIFGSGEADDAPRDAETGQRDPIGYYRNPFRARLSAMERGSERERFQAHIVAHVAIGGMTPQEAAIAMGIPSCVARDVAEPALFFFLHSMSDLRVHLPQQEPLAESVTAA